VWGELWWVFCFYWQEFNNRFKTFIAHDGTIQSMFGTTEEVFFSNWDFGGAYWEKQCHCSKTYTTFNPMNLVEKWNKPILIIQGGKTFVYQWDKDKAFQASTTRFKSKISTSQKKPLVLKPQNL
jgi:hypothetical protein